jgi:phenylalanyl-tRNA synthetase beta subunit
LLKLPEYSAGFELDISLLQSLRQAAQYKVLSSFPSIEQDATFEVKQEITWQQLEDLVRAELSVACAEMNYIYELKPLDIYHEDKSKMKRLTMRIRISHPAKTLKSEEVNTLIRNTAEVAHETLDAVLI